MHTRTRTHTFSSGPAGPIQRQQDFDFVAASVARRVSRVFHRFSGNSNVRRNQLTLSRNSRCVFLLHPLFLSQHNLCLFSEETHSVGFWFKCDFIAFVICESIEYDSLPKLYIYICMYVCAHVLRKNIKNKYGANKKLASSCNKCEIANFLHSSKWTGCEERISLIYLLFLYDYIFNKGKIKTIEIKN